MSATVSAAVDVYARTAPASRAEFALTTLIDGGVVAAVSAIAAVVVTVGGGSAAMGAILGLLSATTGIVVVLARRGRAVGGVLIGSRLVDISTAAPAGSRFLLVAISGQLRLFSLRRGRDPVSAALGQFRFPDAVTREAGNLASTGSPEGGPVVIRFDSGQALLVSQSLLLGREPGKSSEPGMRVFEWTDLSRTLSKTHLRLDWDGRVVWATDLGSTNGTAIEVDGRLQRLPAGERLPLPPTCRLHLGDRSLTVQAPHD
jgi:hypothetical protein